MSLINKVLRDLEARERGERKSPKPSVLDDLRPASGPADRRSPWPLRIVGLVLAAAGVAGAAWWYLSQGREVAAPHLAQAAAPLSRPARPSPVSAAPPAPARPQPTPYHPAPPPRALPARAQVPAPSRAIAHPRVRAARLAHPHFVSRRPPPAISRRPAPLTASDQAQSAYRRAVLALRAGQGSQARRACRAALRFDPAALRPALLLATLDLQALHLRAAHDVLAGALRHHPQALPAAMLLAQVDLRRAQPAAAVHTLLRLRAAGAGSRTYWALLAVSQLRSGDPSAARATYRSGLERFPRDGALWAGLGFVDGSTGHTARADRAFRHAAACPLSPALARFVHAQMQAFGKAP
ncbi:tetratricopeptide repeat protein [Acidiferrobacter sp.]|uniref:tetratricopeptide repeat protein n=1 Tax=Acidiferrobacter sp. TaxID=1872107 RepID=UPI002636E651|nr:tetratricopeptide repeat protein [Acidiferrobacter sp.]